MSSSRAHDDESHVKVLQFTDTHLFATPDKKLCGMNTDASLRAVLDLSHELNERPDFILATGDLSQDVTEASYKRFLEYFDALRVPVFCLPGNHDSTARMNKILDSDNVQIVRQILADEWQVLLLDSTVPGKNGGHLRKEELCFLDQCLSVHDDKPTLVCLHHNLLPTETRWLDTMTVNNASEFFEVLDRHENAVAVLTGHIHQDLVARRKNIRIIGTPSTCIQFAAKTPTFTLDTQTPGYRRLDLGSRGTIQTDVVRLKKFEFTPEYSSKGY